MQLECRKHYKPHAGPARHYPHKKLRAWIGNSINIFFAILPKQFSTPVCKVDMLSNNFGLFARICKKITRCAVLIFPRNNSVCDIWRWMMHWFRITLWVLQPYNNSMLNKVRNPYCYYIHMHVSTKYAFAQRILCAHFVILLLRFATRSVCVLIKCS